MLRNKPFWITLALLSAYLLAGYFIGPRVLQPRLQQWTADSLGYQLAWNRLQFDPITLSADITGARLLAGDKSSWPGLNITAASVHLRFNFWKGKPAVSEVLVRQPLAELAADSEQPYPWIRHWREWRQGRLANSTAVDLGSTRWRIQQGLIERAIHRNDGEAGVLVSELNLQVAKIDETGALPFELELLAPDSNRIAASGLLQADSVHAQGVYQLSAKPGSFVLTPAFQVETPGGFLANGNFQLQLLDDALQLDLRENRLQSDPVVFCWSSQLLCSRLTPVVAHFDASGMTTGHGMSWQEIDSRLEAFGLDLDLGGGQLEWLDGSVFSSGSFSFSRRQPLQAGFLEQPGSFDFELTATGDGHYSATGVFDSAAEFAELQFSTAEDTPLSMGPESAVSDTPGNVVDAPISDPMADEGLSGLLRLRNLAGMPSQAAYSYLEVKLQDPGATLARDFLQQHLAERVMADGMSLHLEATQAGSDLSVLGTLSLQNARLTGEASVPAQDGMDPEWLLALWQDPENNVTLQWPGRALAEDHPASLREFLEARALSQLQESVAEPFSLLGRLLVQQPDLPDEVVFMPGSAALNNSSEHLVSNLTGILVNRPGLALHAPAVYDSLIDRKALQAEQIRTHIALASAAEAEFQSGAAQTDFSDPVVHSVIDEFARRRLPAPVLAGFFELFGEADVDRGIQPEGDAADYYAALFELLVEYAEIPQGALATLAKYRSQAVLGTLARAGINEEQLPPGGEPQQVEARVEGVPMKLRLQAASRLASANPEPAVETGSGNTAQADQRTQERSASGRPPE